MASGAGGANGEEGGDDAAPMETNLADEPTPPAADKSSNRQRRLAPPLLPRLLSSPPRHEDCAADTPMPVHELPRYSKYAVACGLCGIESGIECGGAAQVKADLAPIPSAPIRTMDMRRWSELLPKALHDSFGPVVELCELTPDASKPSDNTVKHAMDARDNKTSKIGRGGAELFVPPQNLILTTLPDGRCTIGAAMWAVVESIERDRRCGPYTKVSVVRIVVKPEYRRGDKALNRRNLKLELFLALVDALGGEPGRRAFTIADAACISTKRGAMWTRIFQAARAARPHMAFDAEGLDEAQSSKRDGVNVLPCILTDASSAPPAVSVASACHPADEFMAKMQTDMGWTAEDDVPNDRLPSGRNLLIPPYTAAEKAALTNAVSAHASAEEAASSSDPDALAASQASITISAAPAWSRETREERPAAQARLQCVEATDPSQRAGECDGGGDSDSDDANGNAAPHARKYRRIAVSDTSEDESAGEGTDQPPPASVDTEDEHASNSPSTAVLALPAVAMPVSDVAASNSTHLASPIGSVSSASVGATLPATELRNLLDDEAGDSAGSDGGSSKDDERGSIDDFVVPDEQASESNPETEDECAQPNTRRLKRLRRTCESSGAAAVANALPSALLARLRSAQKRLSRRASKALQSCQSALSLERAEALVQQLEAVATEFRASHHAEVDEEGAVAAMTEADGTSEAGKEACGEGASAPAMESASAGGEDEAVAVVEEVNDGGGEQGEEEVAAPKAKPPSTLPELLAALSEERDSLADPCTVFGRVDGPARAIRTPALKAFRAAGGDDRLLSKTEPLPDGFHVLQVRARPHFLHALRPAKSWRLLRVHVAVRYRRYRRWTSSCAKICLLLPS